LTARLALERWTEAHTELLIRLSAMPAVTRFIADGKPWSAARAQIVAADKREHWSRHGFGWRAAIERATGQPVGVMSANRVGANTAGVDPEDHEIGWWLDPVAWGRGLAGEGAAALCEELFEVVAAANVVARIQPANAASIAVAETIGLRYAATTTGAFGEAIAVYRLTAQDWRGGGSA
jgi:RimJ/RimL family protein N-acetyltransferase